MVAQIKDIQVGRTFKAHCGCPAQRTNAGVVTLDYGVQKTMVRVDHFCGDKPNSVTYYFDVNRLVPFDALASELEAAFA